MDSLGEWSWPGRAAEAVEGGLPLPPAWVPRLPAPLEPVALGAPSGALAPRRRRSLRLLVLTGLLSAVAALIVLLALKGSLGFDHLLGGERAAPSRARHASAISPATPQTPPVTISAESADGAGSVIGAASFHSTALDGTGSFHVYLPPGYASTTEHYPVLYLLHGNDQLATAFLELGLQEQLDKLIERGEIPPLIAVMIQGGRGANNWRNSYESYVLEVQQLIDRTLPTIATRSARAIAGDSMGAYGAMNIALGNPRRFSIVESWLGFFNGLEGELKTAQPVIKREGLRAFIYGGASDQIANPDEDAPFAAQLRAAGANAHSAVYAGGHTMETLREHLVHMLIFAGRALSSDRLQQSVRAADGAGARSGAYTDER